MELKIQRLIAKMRFSNMSKLEELMVYISTQDRLGFLKFRQQYVKEYGHDKFKRLLKEANKGLKDEQQEH